MKKSIPLRVQNIVKFIPYFNCLILFMWLFNYSQTDKDPKVFGKSLIVMFCVCSPLVFLQIIASRVFANLSGMITIVDQMFLYVIPFSLGCALIKFQESIGLQ